MKLKRKVAAVFAAAAIGLAGGLAVNALAPSPALAHGAQMTPGSRQFLCWQDATTGGVPVANNAACANALAQAGENWYWNWFGNLHSSNNGGTVGSIPDGRICDGADGGPYDFRPFNDVRNDWPYTRLTAGSTIQFRHNDWAHHPGDFNVYVTTQGWNPNTPLAWSELELVDTATNPPRASGPDGLGYYYWNTTLPSNRSGEHIIFVHWVRSDSPEDFFSCSDVRFDGGNGEVVFPGGGTQPPPPPPPPPPPTTDPPPPPPPTTDPPPPPPPGGDCSVTYAVNDWGQGFQADVTVVNGSGSAINGWELTWTFPSGQSIDQLWNGVDNSAGANASVSNVGWNGTLAANGGSASFGFLGSPGGGSAPSSFSLNGTACTVS